MIVKVQLRRVRFDPEPTDYRKPNGKVRERYRDLALVQHDDVVIEHSIQAQTSVMQPLYNPENFIYGITSVHIAAGPADVADPEVCVCHRPGVPLGDFHAAYTERRIKAVKL